MTEAELEDRAEHLRRARLYVVGASAVETAETGEHEITADELEVSYYAKNPRNGDWYAELSAFVTHRFIVRHSEKAEETYVLLFEQRKYQTTKITKHTFSHHDY